MIRTKNNLMSSKIFILSLFGIVSVLGYSCNKSKVPDDVLDKLSQKIKLIEAPFSKNNFEFLDSLITDKNIIQLGESIHITHEFPTVRNEIVKYLNSKQDFDILALEGSAIDTWIGMDYLLGYSDSLDLHKVQEFAWFGLWQTQEMQEIIRTVNDSKQTSSDLYLAAFDIQPNSGRLYSNQSIFDTLFQKLSFYKEYDDDITLNKWKRDFSYLIQCQGFKNDSLRNIGALKKIKKSIIEFDSLWVKELYPFVSELTTEIHGKATKLLPDNLMDRYCHCSEVTRKGIIDWRRYQIVRDSLNAQNVIMIGDSLSKNNKVITWAHHSHIHYNSNRKNIPSMGQYLKEQEGQNIYSIGCFAGEGKALIANDDWLFPILAINIKPDTDIENILSQVDKGNFFLNTKDLTVESELTSYFSGGLSSRMENNGKLNNNLPQDFDGIIFCSAISPPDLLLLPKMAKNIPFILGWLYENWLLLIFISMLFIVFVVYRKRINKNNIPKILKT